MAVKYDTKQIILGIALVLCSLLCLAQDVPEGPAETPPEESESVAGGVEYQPKLSVEGVLRDPFKSPFDLQREEEERRRRERESQLGDLDDRLEYLIGDLSLKGIYLQARSGYWAIFEIDGEYIWKQVGTKFRDGDLMNITDNSVHFSQFINDGSEEIATREVIKELRRSEE